MIERYQRAEMKKIWSDKSKFDAYLKVELAASYAWQQLGLFDLDTYEKISNANYKLKDILDIEKQTKHDVVAFTKAVSNSLGEEKKYFHYGLTSTDVVDSAHGVLLKKANKLIKKDMKALMEVLKEKAYLYKDTPIMGRTHGMHAEVTSFGLKFALWYEDFKRLYQGFVEASKLVEASKFSGAVGNYAANNPEIEKIASKKLGLTPAYISTQTLQRDRHAKYVLQIAIIGSQLEKMAVEIRHLSRSEVHEVSEFFDINQKGSSAMPHKKNPISSENITGLSRILRGYTIPALENIALWHERDISHSSVERIILVDSTTLIDYMLNRYTNTLSKLIVYENKMLENINLSYGANYAQHVLNLLIDKGFDRTYAYDIIQKLAYQAMNEQISFKELILSHQEINQAIKIDELNPIFNPKQYLKHTDYIFNKIFN
ncbi:adenylosuccinate lyase [Mariniplasma anaerobium]|uniref:Adenylosuccinate lyase n=1 Tax=Mariniplasma anaerobium TaxID=2735436 RepID=A0A7U9TH59_9MOLU|nr:adenylosuccinate lyase [Mariniplasma anaerobium]BCR36213.1 adenylosuccinate lyase [Mariniplasma anaerobium]